jgi:copper oxidase (laccase) domain-containing protein
MQMGRCTVEAMQREFGSDPRDMLAAVGPSISGAHYEVSWDVARHFEPEFRPLEYPGRGLPAEEEKYMLDLWGVNRKILMDAGIPEENIQLPNLCTFENADIMFSHRASHGKRGNLGAFISIR